MADKLSYTMNIITGIKNLEMKDIMYGMIGGIYFSPRFKPWMKRGWLWCNLIFGTINCITIIGYFATEDYTDWKTIFYASCVAENTVFGILLCPLMTYYFRRELNLVLHLNTKENRKNVEEMEHLRAVKNNITYINFGALLLYVIIYLGHTTYPLIAAKDDYFHDAKFYVIPNPLMQNVNSHLQFISLTLFMGFISSVPIIPTFLFQVNILVVAYEFYVAFSILCHRIEQFSRNSEISFAQINEEYVNLRFDSKIVNRYHKKETEAECQKLLRNVVEAIKVYQRLRKGIRKMTLYLESQFSILIILIVVTQLLLITAVYSLNMTGIEKFKGITMVAYVLVFLFCHCYTGRIFSEMGEMVAIQVYDIPWYNLDSRRRKTFYIFLHLAQKPICFYGNKIYAMGMPIFSQVARLGYTYYNFLNHMYHARNTVLK